MVCGPGFIGTRPRRKSSEAQECGAGHLRPEKRLDGTLAARHRERYVPVEECAVAETGKRRVMGQFCFALTAGNQKGPRNCI
jgi:hypothetical protein